MDDIAKSRSQLIEDTARMYQERIEIRSVGFELLQQQTNFEQLLYSSPAVILTFNPNGTLCSFSEGAERLFGYEELDVINRCVDFLMPDLNLPVDGLMDFFSQRAVQQVDQWHSPIVARHVDNSVLYLTADISEVGGATGFQQMLVVLQNITKQKIAEQEYARYTTNLERLIGDLKDELRLSKESAVNAGFAEEDALAVVVNELSQPLKRLLGEVKKGLDSASNRKKYSCLVQYFKSIESEGEALSRMLDEFVGP